MAVNRQEIIDFVVALWERLVEILPEGEQFGSFSNDYFSLEARPWCDCEFLSDGKIEQHDPLCLYNCLIFQYGDSVQIKVNLADSALSDIPDSIEGFLKMKVHCFKSLPVEGSEVVDVEKGKLSEQAAAAPESHGISSKEGE